MIGARWRVVGANDLRSVVCAAVTSLTTEAPRPAGGPGSPGTGTSSADPTTAPKSPIGRRDVPLWLAVLAASVIVAAIVLRFWTRSNLWLDEAQTVNISRLAVGQIPHALRQDGAPPLFYVLLHYWMAAFGTGDLAVRSLSGLFGVATLPLVWLGGRRLGGARVGWAALMIVATSPFAVYYATEARMYALVTFLTAVGLLALLSVLAKPRPVAVIGLGVVTGLLLYSHYWSFYLVAVTGLWLCWRAWHAKGDARRATVVAIGSIVVGSLTFLPWVPTFLFQARHTGTPWATPANFSAMVHAVAKFAGGGTTQGRALALAFFTLALIGVFGAAIDDRRIELDLKTRPAARPLAIIGLGTLFVAIAAGYVSHSAFSSRYTSVVFVPIVLLVAWGTRSLRSDTLRRSVLAAMVLFGLAGAIPNITTNRTQSGQVAAAIRAHVQAGDVVAYCPDQLGPSTSRLLPQSVDQITFPRRTPPQIVDWIDYAKVNEAASVASFVHLLERQAAGAHTIWMVWAPGYATYGSDCEQITADLQADRAFRAVQVVNAHPARYYEPMYLWRFTPLVRR